MGRKIQNNSLVSDDSDFHAFENKLPWQVMLTNDSIFDFSLC